MSDGRDYLREAKDMLGLGSPYLPEVNHLVALKAEHDRQLVEIARNLDLLKREVLNGE